MKRFLLLFLYIFSIPVSAGAERLWLVIGASDQAAAGIVCKAKPLSSLCHGGFIIQTADCGEKQNMFAWVAEATTSAEKAQATRVRLRKIVKDSYIKPCDVKGGTLLSLRITAIDPSIANVPTTAVNWQDEDRVSSTRPLPDGRILVKVPYFVHDPDDPLEGKRERVILMDTSGKRSILEENCIDIGSAVTYNGRIAFQCVREQAGDHLLHSVLVFDDEGEKLKELQRCRDPIWSGEHAIVCKEESVGPDGQIELKAKLFELVK